MTFTWEHVLYRLYDQDGALLYVGITNSIPNRFKRHADEQRWWPEVTGCRVEFLPDRAALQRAERDAIWFERPRHNIMGSVTPPHPAAARPRTGARPGQPQYVDVPERLFGGPRKKVPLRQRVSDGEWAWIHNLPPHDNSA